MAAVGDEHCRAGKAARKGEGKSRQLFWTRDIKLLLQNVEIFITEAVGFVSIRLIMLA